MASRAYSASIHPALAGPFSQGNKNLPLQGLTSWLTGSSTWPPREQRTRGDMDCRSRNCIMPAPGLRSDGCGEL